jgi:hypothetical protein
MAVLISEAGNSHAVAFSDLFDVMTCALGDQVLRDIDTADDCLLRSAAVLQECSAEAGLSIRSAR